MEGPEVTPPREELVNAVVEACRALSDAVRAAHPSDWGWSASYRSAIQSADAALAALDAYREQPAVFRDGGSLDFHRFTKAKQKPGKAEAARRLRLLRNFVSRPDALRQKRSLGAAGRIYMRLFRAEPGYLPLCSHAPLKPDTILTAIRDALRER